MSTLLRIGGVYDEILLYLFQQATMAIAERKASSVYDRLGYYNAMAVAAERKASSVFDRLGKGPRPTKKTCIYWVQGRCNRINCPYMHSEQPAPKTKQLAPKTKQQLPPKTKHLLAPKTKQQLLANHLKPSINVDTTKRKVTWRNNNLKKPSDGDSGSHVSDNGSLGKQQEPDSRKVTSSSEDNEVNVIKCPISDSLELMKEEMEGSSVKTTQPQDSCVNGDKRESLHTWSNGAGLTKLTELKGHSKAITGIALPSGSIKLYTMSKDKCIRSWDCHTGQCAGTECLNAEVGCIITRGPWLFAGLQNNVKAWNLQYKVEFSLNLTGGRVHSLEFENDILFAGMEDGSILVWRRNPETSDFELAATMNGHNGPVNSLIIRSGHGKIYSGSADCSIKVWDQHLQCIQTLNGHTREVTSLFCWVKYLLSASLDKTLKVWGETESGTVEMVYEHKEDHGFVSMGGIMNRPEAQHILLCSLVDKSVRLYDFPSFIERGRMFTKEEAPVTQVGVDGLFFIGDEAGEVSVWRLA